VQVSAFVGSLAPMLNATAGGDDETLRLGENLVGSLWPGSLRMGPSRRSFVDYFAWNELVQLLDRFLARRFKPSGLRRRRPRPLRSSFETTPDETEQK